MSNKQAKKMRREMRRSFRKMGLSPEALEKRFALRLKPKPRWIPAVVWRLIVWRVVREPGAPQ